MNCEARQHVNITAPSEGAVPPPMRRNLIGRAQIEQESPIAVELMKIDHVQQPEEFQKMVIEFLLCMDNSLMKR